MTETDRPSRAGPPRGATAGTPSKATLFCPNCGHADRYDGSWRHVESVRTTRYRCPDCGAVVTKRPNEGMELDPVDYWRSAWETSLRLWDGLTQRV